MPDLLLWELRDRGLHDERSELDPDCFIVLAETETEARQYAHGYLMRQLALMTQIDAKRRAAMAADWRRWLDNKASTARTLRWKPGVVAFSHYGPYSEGNKSMLLADTRGGSFMRMQDRILLAAEMMIMYDNHLPISADFLENRLRGIIEDAKDDATERPGDGQVSEARREASGGYGQP